VPRRRCVGCGRIAPKSELVRIVAQPSAAGSRPLAVRDREGTMPGRGAYVCRGERPGELAAGCLALAIRRGGIPRTLRAPVTLDHKIVESVSR